MVKNKKCITYALQWYCWVIWLWAMRWGHLRSLLNPTQILCMMATSLSAQIRGNVRHVLHWNKAAHAPLHPLCSREGQEKCLPHNLKPFEDAVINPNLPHRSEMDRVTSLIQWKLIFTTLRSTFLRTTWMFQIEHLGSFLWSVKCTLYLNFFLFYL